MDTHSNGYTQINRTFKSWIFYEGGLKVPKCEIFDHSDFQVSMGKGMTL
jgi:hypothetical protein